LGLLGDWEPTLLHNLRFALTRSLYLEALGFIQEVSDTSVSAQARHPRFHHPDSITSCTPSPLGILEGEGEHDTGNQTNHQQNNILDHTISLLN
jgi:hypothetical protein